jgi:hypothetical protein
MLCRVRDGSKCAQRAQTAAKRRAERIASLRTARPEGARPFNWLDFPQDIPHEYGIYYGAIP